MVFGEGGCVDFSLSKEKDERVGAVCPSLALLAAMSLSSVFFSS